MKKYHPMYKYFIRQRFKNGSIKEVIETAHTEKQALEDAWEHLEGFYDEVESIEIIDSLFLGNY